MDKLKTENSLLIRIGGLTVAVAIISLIVQGYSLFWNKDYKMISVTRLSDSSFLEKISKSDENLEVFYNGKPVASPRLFSAKYSNTGTLPIEASDIEQPLKLTFGSAKLIGASISKTVPPGIKASVSIKGNNFILSHSLLNPGESIYFRGCPR